MKPSLLQVSAQKITDLLLPPACLKCHAPVAEVGLCGTCWGELHFIEPPCCRQCGLMLEGKGPLLCGACIAEAPEFDEARAALLFDDKSKELIHAYKYHDRLHFAPTFTRWMMNAGEAILATADIIIPVPLSRRRLFSRTYNQSALLARTIAKEKGLTFLPLALTRIRHTTPQVGLTRAARKKNVKGAFHVPVRYHERIKGKHITLVDDVMTTGITASECAAALKEVRAAKVSVLTLARVKIGEA